MIVFLTKTNPTPGTPSKHLFEEAATASKDKFLALKGNAPKALMASMKKDKFFLFYQLYKKKIHLYNIKNSSKSLL
jgi:hypothetical protein